MSGRHAFGALVVLAAGVSSFGCRDCDEPYPVGTRFRVTVPEAFSGCHVTFEAGATYDLVAGPTTEDADTCEYNVAQDPPTFTSTELVLSACRGANTMGVDCRAQLTGCPEVDYSHVTMTYRSLPDAPGDVVNTSLFVVFVSAAECRKSCQANIPVTVRW